MRLLYSMLAAASLTVMTRADDTRYTLNLQPTFHTGQVLTAELTIHSTAKESFLRKGRVESQQRERRHGFKGRLEVLAATDDGTWTTLAVTPTAAWQHNLQKREHYEPLGTTVWITRNKGTVEYRFSDDKALNAKQQSILAHFFSPPAAVSPDDAFGPDEPVAVDDSWPVNAEKVAAMFNATGTTLQVSEDQVKGRFRLVQAEGDRESGTLEVKGFCEFSDLLKSARRAGKLVPDRSAARMDVRYVLHQNPELPRQTAELNFQWAFSGRLVVNPQVRRTVKMTNIRKETLTPVKADKPAATKE